MKFEDVYSRRTADKLTQEQAAEILGVSVRTVRRWEDRFEADGAEGLYDRRLGKLANNRVPTDTVIVYFPSNWVFPGACPFSWSFSPLTAMSATK
ncbi:helix-turn-helix domain-containing protein [Tateyamaria sp.]|uniref:helix-turn-helix domain-containing protein n=1 Tax=Tateyamaria sp. TaxID=1929288 RepID=UPI003B21F4AD